MSDEKNKPWVDKKGMPVSFKDCSDACHHAISVMLKEFKTNPVLSESDKLGVKYLYYERQINVMEVMKEKFEMMHRHAQKVQRKTVKKRQKLIH